MNLLVTLVAAVAAFSAAQAQAKLPHTGPDFSGTYDCKGRDAHDGDFTGALTLKLIPAQSFGTYSAYTLRSELPGLGAYEGYAAVQGTHLSMYFGLTDPAPKDYGTGTATFKKGKGGRWSFHLYYFQPEYHGGNHGLEDCVKRDTRPPTP